MPTYQMDKTYKSGFYDNWKDVNGNDMRVYTAQDMRKPYDVVFSDGIMPEADGTAGDMLKVSLLADMQIAVGKGHAKVGGAWFENTALYKITLDPAESTTRYDCIIIRNDDTERVAESSIYVKSMYSVPTVGNLARNDKVYELCLAYVEVPAFSENLTAGNIIDTREDGNLCNVMRGVGATVIRTYQNTYFTEAENQTEIPIGISQFDRTRDALSVVVEGRIMTAGTNFNITDNEKVTFNIGFPKIGTKIDFEVAKNVNATGAETVIQEVAQLRKEMTAANKKLEYIYYCNGVNDNVVISEMAQQYLNGGSNIGNLTISIHGNFGAEVPFSGDGTTGDPFIWLAIGNDDVGNRRVTLDFAGCRAVNLAQGNASYCLFNGRQYTVKNLYLTVAGSESYIYGQPVYWGTKRVYFENCVISADVNEGWLFNYGTFRDCEFTIKTASDMTAVFRPMLSSDMIRVYGGEHLAYTRATSGISAVVYCAGDIASAVIIADGLSCPTKAISGYRQSYAVYDIATAKYHTYSNLITELLIDAASQTVRDIIVANK